MTVALAGVVGYLALGTLGLLGAGRAAALAAWAAGVAALSLWAPGFEETQLGIGLGAIRFAGDGLAVALWGLALLLHAAVMWEERRREGAFHPLVTLLVGTTLALVLSRDLFNLYVCLELTSLLSFLLVGYQARTQAVWASVQYLILTTVGLILYLFGVGLVYARLGTLALSQVAVRPDLLSDPSLAVGAGMLMAGAAAKGGVFFLGLWLPQAHGQAPTAISALLSGLVVKMGVVTMLRLTDAFQIGWPLLAMGVATGVFGLIYAMWERDLKVFLAYSTMSQLGYVLIGLGLGGGARTAAIGYAVGHGVFKALLFLAAGRGVDTAGRRRLPELTGRLHRSTTVALGWGMWAIVGLPPLSGFALKEGLGAASPAWAQGVLVGLSVGTAAAYCRLLPLLRPGRPGGTWGATGLLMAAALGLGGWQLAAGPPLPWPAWPKAALVVVSGYAVHLLLRRLPVRLPRITFDRAVLALVISAVALGLGLQLSA